MSKAARKTLVRAVQSRNRAVVEQVASSEPLATTKHGPVAQPPAAITSANAALEFRAPKKPCDKVDPEDLPLEGYTHVNFGENAQSMFRFMKWSAISY